MLGTHCQALPSPQISPLSYFSLCVGARVWIAVVVSLSCLSPEESWDKNVGRRVPKGREVTENVETEIQVCPGMGQETGFLSRCGFRPHRTKRYRAFCSSNLEQ